MYAYICVLKNFKTSKTLTRKVTWVTRISSQYVVMCTDLSKTPPSLSISTGPSPTLSSRSNSKASLPLSPHFLWFHWPKIIPCPLAPVTAKLPLSLIRTLRAPIILHLMLVSFVGLSSLSFQTSSYRAGALSYSSVTAGKPQCFQTWNEVESRGRI